MDQRRSRLQVSQKGFEVALYDNKLPRMQCVQRTWQDLLLNTGRCLAWAPGLLQAPAKQQLTPTQALNACKKIWLMTCTSAPLPAVNMQGQSKGGPKVLIWHRKSPECNQRPASGCYLHAAYQTSILHALGNEQAQTNWLHVFTESSRSCQSLLS